MIWIALFRGLNVGGHGILPMKKLVPLLEGLGCKDVRTYIQSGNAVFRHSEKDASRMSSRIGKKILEEFGFKPSVLILSPGELSKAAQANPFPKACGSPATLYLYFLVERAGAPDFDKLKSLQGPRERFELKLKIFYLHAPDGVGRSKLAGRVEKCLGVQVTARNWATVSQVLMMAEELA